MAKQKRQRTRDIVAEGLYIAAAATRLSLKNTILVHILAEGGDFDPERYLPDARAALEALAAEAEADAARTSAERGRARGRHYDSLGTHDYRARDVRNLRRREKQSRHVAEQLRLRAADDHELRLLISDARDAAWAEVSFNIDRALRIEASRPDLEPDYSRMRGARMQALRLVDLPKLRAQRRTAKAQRALHEAGELPPLEGDVRRDRSGGQGRDEIDPGELE